MTMTFDILNQWKNHCPICDAELSEFSPGKPSKIICSRCKHPLGQLEVEDVPLWVPRKLGDFELDEFIGRGGMGIVFRGHSSKNEPVAVKVALGNFTGQLDNELTILQQASQLKTPHIASLRGTGTETVGSRVLRWVATRWIGSRTLSSIMTDEEIDLSARLRILENVARGIYYLHENKIVHGDICPDNIMLTDDNEPYLGDFGVSRSLSLEDKEKTVQVSSSVGGKAKYGAPEIWAGKEPGPKSDIYSFGIVALEFLTKKDLSEAKLSDIRPPLERDLRKTLERCCEKIPEDRPASMDAICSEFVMKGRREIISPFLAAVLCSLSLAIGLLLGSMMHPAPKAISSASAIPTRPDPQPPTNLNIEAPSPTTLALTWEAPTEQPQGYIIQWRESANDRWNTERVDGNATRCEIKKGVQPDTPYVFNLFSYNTAEETHSSSVGGSRRTPAPPDAPSLPPQPPPDWLRFTLVKKAGKWVQPNETDRLDDFTQWKIDGTVDQFVNRQLAELIDDLKDRLIELELADCNDLKPEGFVKLLDARVMTDLTIRNCSRFNDEAVKMLFPKLGSEAKSVEEDISNLPLGDLVEELLENVPLSPIKRLNIIDCPVSDASLEYLPSTLQRLRLNECTGMTDKGLEVIASRFVELQHLSIKNTKATFVGIPKLFGLGWSSNYWTAGATTNIVKVSETFPLQKLRRLEVDGCSMKGFRGNFGPKLEEGLKKHCENVTVTGIIH